MTAGTLYCVGSGRVATLAGKAVRALKFRQAVAYAQQARQLPQVEQAMWFYSIEAGAGGYIVRVIDRQGTMSDIEHDREIRSLIAIWRQQAAEPVKATAKEGQ